MKRIITMIVIALFTFNFQAEAQNCNQGKKLAEKTWEKFGPWKPNFTIVPFKNKVKKVKNSWNWIVNNSGSTIGPRLLEVDGGNETGTIVGQTSSTFVTPPSFENRMEITINKYSGRAKTGVVICAMGQDGVLTQLRDYEFPNDRNGKVKTFTVNNVKGKIIIVAMKNLSVGNKFQYRINAK
tara:strand:- start:27251 stop:27796 length:546 start_codon:yes stop_codon:yes gene_type:complete